VYIQNAAFEAVIALSLQMLSKRAIVFRLSLYVAVFFAGVPLLYLAGLALEILTGLPSRFTGPLFLLLWLWQAIRQCPKVLRRSYRIVWWHIPAIMAATLFGALPFMIAFGLRFIGSESSQPMSLIYLLTGFASGGYCAGVGTLYLYDRLMQKRSLRETAKRTLRRFQTDSQ
jgi:RsiW-degrading membrane proteinase PrsW (M82 family)